MPICAWWANDLTVELQCQYELGYQNGHARMCLMSKWPWCCKSMGWEKSMNLRWHDSAQWLMSYNISKNWDTWQAWLNVRNGQITLPLQFYRLTLPLHIYGPTWIHGTWEGMNQPCSWVTTSIRIGVPNWLPNVYFPRMELEMARFGQTVMELQCLHYRQIDADYLIVLLTFLLKGGGKYI